MFHLKLLGSPSLRREGYGGPVVVGGCTGVAVLAYLAMSRNRPSRRSRLARLLWPDRSESHGRCRLRQALYYLHSEAGARFVEPSEDPLVLSDARLTVDLWEFDRAVDAERYQEAVRLYDGPFLDTFHRPVSQEFRSWRQAENARVRWSLKRAYQELIRSLLEEGAVDDAIRYGHEWVELNPLDADSESALIRALLQAGDWTAASGAYERYRALLRNELGETPEEELRHEIEKARSHAS